MLLIVQFFQEYLDFRLSIVLVYEYIFFYLIFLIYSKIIDVKSNTKEVKYIRIKKCRYIKTIIISISIKMIHLYSLKLFEAYLYNNHIFKCLLLN